LSWTLLKMNFLDNSPNFQQPVQITGRLRRWRESPQIIRPLWKYVSRCGGSLLRKLALEVERFLVSYSPQPSPSLLQELKNILVQVDVREMICKTFWAAAKLIWTVSLGAELGAATRLLQQQRDLISHPLIPRPWIRDECLNYHPLIKNSFCRVKLVGKLLFSNFSRNYCSINMCGYI
jgi:hypothetical protein